MNRKSWLVVALLPAIAACTTPAATGPARPAPSARPVPPQQAPAVPPTTFRQPRVMAIPGVTGVIGADGKALIRQFGTPRLEVWEADARKLQFTGTACILDIFLYPQSPGGTETATYVEARRSDGRDVDRAACIAALRR